VSSAATIFSSSLADAKDLLLSVTRTTQIARRVIADLASDARKERLKIWGAMTAAGKFLIS
jgi:hypothetical protein